MGQPYCIPNIAKCGFPQDLINSPKSGTIGVVRPMFDALGSMSETFQIFCPSCNSKLNAKVSLEGQTRNCPKCQTPILIQRYFDLDESVAESSEPSAASADHVRSHQLEFQNRYFVIGIDRVIAVWEGNKGWYVNVGTGFAPARSNITAIPDQGVFAFVEMRMDSGIPQRLEISKISSRGALTALYRDAHAILGKLEGHVDLTVGQKDAFLRHLRQMFMSSVLDNASDVLSYLMTLSPVESGA